MYTKDKILKNAIHKLNNRLMCLRLNISEMSDHLENRHMDDETIVQSLDKQNKYISNIAETLKNVRSLSGQATDALSGSTVEEGQKLQGGVPEKFSGRVLLVDNEEELLKIMKRCLEKVGLEVDAALSSEEGLQKLRNQKYKYLLTDLDMPVMDGQQLISAAKNESLLDDTIIIVTTGSISEECLGEKEDFLVRNVDGFLQKPFSIEELYWLIKSFQSCK